MSITSTAPAVAGTRAATALAHAPRLLRRKWMPALAATLVVTIVAGAAVAFFITRRTYEENRVGGGELTVTAHGLPLVFGDRLFPTDELDPEHTSSDTFEVENRNPVDVSYLIGASCAECATDAAKRDQFGNLIVRITPQEQVQLPPPVGPEPVYEGRLADLKDVSLGLLHSSESQEFEVEIWLRDNGAEQPQSITNLFEITISARTPAVS